MRAVVFLVGMSVLGAGAPFASADPPAKLVPIRPGVFEQELGTAYTVHDGLPSDNVYAIAVTSRSEVYAGTDKGLARYDGQRWAAVEAVPTEPVRRLAIEEPFLFVATDTALFRLDESNTGTQLAALPAEPSELAVGPDGIWIGTQTGLFHLQGGELIPASRLNTLLGDKPSIRQIAFTSDGGMAVAAEAGLYERKNEEWERLLPLAGTASWAVRDTRGTVVDRNSRLWFASPQGVGCFDGAWILYTGSDGLPYNDFTGATCGEDDVVWFGTKVGAIRFDGRHWAYREGKRWLPGNDVRDIAVTPNGNAWFATAEGVGLIERRPMTLAEKARFYEDEIDRYHRRTPYGYVMSVRLAEPGDKGKWYQRDDDNDGQWTGEYGAAECFAYAATQDPKAKQRAKAAFEALRFLSQVTQGGSHPAPKGFPARTILPTDGPRNPNMEESYSVEADQRRRTKDALWKVIHPRWPTSDDGKWYWKCDTSSDELDGHYFLNARYYDLVAETEEEKARVRQVVRDMTDHLVQHDLKLVDHDGKPTRWANFSPDSLNRDAAWWAGRGLNSLSILGHLRVAQHVTGDAKYGALADELAWKHGYAMNVMYPKQQRGPGSFVQFDDEMAFMNYYNLLMYEKDPRLREMFALSCHDYWELEACERNAFYNFAFAALCQNATVRSPWGTRNLSPDRKCIEDAVNTLKRYPMNLVNWRQTNSHRIDILPLSELVRSRGEAKGLGYCVDGTVLPIDERFVRYWSDDPWKLDSGGDGRDLATGMPFLLAYYMGLYHGFIED